MELTQNVQRQVYLDEAGGVWDGEKARKESGVVPGFSKCGS